MECFVSVIIPTYKRPNFIQRLLKDLLVQTISVEKFEIIVVDNNSGDTTKNVVGEFVKKFPANIFYYNQKKKGAAAVRNLGVKYAKSDIILFLDDDMLASPKLIQEHLKTHANHSNDEICVLGYFKTEWEKKDDVFLKFLQKSEMQNDFPADTDDEISFQYFYTGNISCAKKAIQKVNGFDEGYDCYGVEDIDLGYRLVTQGVKIYFNKNAFSVHNYNPRLDAFLKKREHAGISLGYFLFKYPHLKAYFGFGKFPWFFLGVGRLVFCPILSPYIEYYNKGDATVMHYIYFRLLLRWTMYKSFFFYTWNKKKSAKKSLSVLLR